MNKFIPQLSFIASSLLASTMLPSVTFAKDKLPEVVITAKGKQTLADVLPTSHVFTQEQIEKEQVKDLNALLDRLTGINITDSGGRGSTTGVFIRGTSSSQQVVLIDGVRVGSATLGSAALNNFPIEAIERVEVVKGPLSGIYGADAAGGVIQIFTKKGGENLGTARVSIGSNSLTEYGLSFNGGNNKHSFRISADVEDSDGIDRTSLTDNGADDKDPFEEKAFSIAGKVTLSESTIAQLSVLYSDNESHFDNLFGGQSKGLLTNNKTLNSSLNITSKLSEALSWKTILGNNKDQSITPAPSSFPSDITTKRNSLGTELAYSFGQKNIITVGVDYYDEDIETLNEFPSTDRDNKGIYALLQTSIAAFDIVTSLRHDDNSAYGSDTNGSVALNYNITDSLRAVISYGTAFVAPSFNSLYYPNFGNPDLLPEESESVELSLLGDYNNINWRISAYNTDVENLHSYNRATFLAENIGESEFKGVEFEVGTELLSWEISSSLDLLSAKNKITDKELDGRAERTLRLTAARNFGALDIRFDLKAESGRFDNNGSELSSFSLFDVSGSYQFNDKLRLLLNLDNIFDKDYAVNLIGNNNRYNTEGRQAKLTLRYDF